MTPLVTGIVLSRTFPFVYFLTVEKSLFRGGHGCLASLWLRYWPASKLYRSCLSNSKREAHCVPRTLAKNVAMNSGAARNFVREGSVTWRTSDCSFPLFSNSWNWYKAPAKNLSVDFGEGHGLFGLILAALLTMRWLFPFWTRCSFSTWNRWKWSDQCRKDIMSFLKSTLISLTKRQWLVKRTTMRFSRLVLFEVWNPQSFSISLGEQEIIWNASLARWTLWNALMHKRKFFQRRQLLPTVLSRIICWPWIFLFLYMLKCNELMIPSWIND